MDILAKEFNEFLKIKKVGNSYKSKNDSSVDITSWENKKKKGSRNKHSIKTSIEAIIYSDDDSNGDEGLKLLSMKNMVKGLPSIDHPDKLYEGCLVGKEHRHSFPKESISRAKATLELIHTDVCGPINLASLGKNRYFLLFIDDYSRKTWLYFLKQDSEVFSTSKRFKALVEKESGYQIKAMKSDRGGEFTSKEFKVFCEENDIRRPLTIPYSP
ncbi:hypothetical protein RJ639_037415 [Escallonia herrerae]|uniref:Integrase catalytic domain-containing protein n=1 Tax=Escallonia herrerae TaxID=1293975 RepID=A0AA88WQD0_9ASTE|nr:hypothetical protein RJ639_037415 [Escallonia herrerae]